MAESLSAYEKTFSAPLCGQIRTYRLSNSGPSGNLCCYAMRESCPHYQQAASQPGDTNLSGTTVNKCMYKTPQERFIASLDAQLSVAVPLVGLAHKVSNAA